MDLRPFAYQALADGTSFFPTGPDKLPAFETLPQKEQLNRKTGELEMRGSWSEYQTRHPTPAEIETWFTDRRVAGFAAVTGPISNNLVALDFEWTRFYKKWCDLVPERHRVDLTEKQTGKGVHVCARVQGDIKSGWRAWSATDFNKDNTNKGAIEVLAGNKPMMFPPSLYNREGLRYKETRGDHSHIQEISLDHWQTLEAAAQACSEWTPVVKERVEREKRKGFSESGDIIERFNARYSPETILERNGYSWNRTGTAMIPPKSQHNTASVHIRQGVDGNDRAYHHSSNDDLYDDQKRGRTAFQLFCQLEHGDTFASAGKAAADEFGLYWHEKAEYAPVEQPAAVLAGWKDGELVFRPVADSSTIVIVDSVAAADVLQHHQIGAVAGPRTIWPGEWLIKLTAWPRRYVCFAPPVDGPTESVALSVNAQVARLPSSIETFFNEQNGSVVEFANYLRRGYQPSFRMPRKRR